MYGMNYKVDKINEVKNQIINKEIPYDFDFMENRVYGENCWFRKNEIIPYVVYDYKDNSKSISFRGFVIENMGYAPVSKSWIEPLSKWIGNRKCLEVMSGVGCLAKALTDCGIDVIPTDNFEWKKPKGGSIMEWNDRMYCDVENIDAVSAVKKYGKDVGVVIMSWADTNDIAIQVLETMRKANEDLIMIYIGEEDNNCPENIYFHDSIVKIEDKEIDNINELYLTFEDTHDSIWLVK